MSSERTYLDILNKHLRALQASRPKAYTLRAIGKRNNISHSLLSKVLNGKKRPSSKTLRALCKDLKIETDEFEEIESRFLTDSEHVKSSKLKYVFSSQERKLNLLKFEDLSIYDKWYYNVVLSLVGCVNFKEDMDWISKKIGISKSEARDAMEFLIAKNFIKFENGEWHTTAEQIVFPKANVLKYQSQIMKRASLLHGGKDYSKEFPEQLFKNVLVTTNSKKIKDAKDVLEKALYDAIQILLGKDLETNDELYTINLQLFSIVNKG